MLFRQAGVDQNFVVGKKSFVLTVVDQLVVGVDVVDRHGGALLVQ